MHNPLAPLLADGVVEEVVARLKSGKEADLWIVRHGGELVAAKVYKARAERSFRNDAGYREGRRVRNTRTQRAMDRGSRFGQAAAEQAWKTKEADALHALHAAGVRVPRPVMFYEGVLLMELVVDAAGHPAPRLVDAHVPPGQAGAFYADLRAQAVRMLSCDIIHGDLSPYNVLVAWNGPVVIDFPQVVGAAHNSQAEHYFRRDLENLRQFFQAADPALSATAGDAREIWNAYVRRELAPDFVPSGRPPPQAAPPPRREGEGRERGQGQKGRPQQPPRGPDARPSNRTPLRAPDARPAPGQHPPDRHPGAQRPPDRRPGEQRPPDRRPGEQRLPDRRPGDQRPANQRAGDRQPPARHPLGPPASGASPGRAARHRVRRWCA